MAEQIKRKVPIQWIQTIKDDGTYEFNPDPNVYSTQKNVPSTSKIDFQNILINGTDPTNPLSSSYATSASYAQTASYAETAQTASYFKGTVVSASYAQTASYLNTLNQDLTFNGNLTLNGTASITYLNVSYESSSVIYSSGSNQFGDTSNDVQTLYGSIIIPTGSLTISGSARITNGLTVTGSLISPSITGSLFGTATTASYAQTSSYIDGGTF